MQRRTRRRPTLDGLYSMLRPREGIRVLMRLVETKTAVAAITSVNHGVARNIGVTYAGTKIATATTDGVMNDESMTTAATTGIVITGATKTALGMMATGTVTDMAKAVITDAATTTMTASLPPRADVTNSKVAPAEKSAGTTTQLSLEAEALL